MGKSLVDEIITTRLTKNQNGKESLQTKTTDDIAHHIDFGARLMSLSELSRQSGIGIKTLRRMVAAGALRSIKIPYSLQEKYSPRQLAAVIVNFNG